MTDARKQALVARECAKPGLRSRVDAFCIHCIYDECGGGGNWRQQVQACTATQCPLYDVRPKSRPEPRVRR